LGIEGELAEVSLTHNERTKLTATYLNTMAGTVFAAGVVAPLAAATFGYSGATAPVSTLTFAIGVSIFFSCLLGSTRPRARS
jgi:hypothetical protein